MLPPEGISFKEVISDFERRLIESTLEAAGGVQKRAAELLHIKPTTLNEMIKRYDIRPRRKRASGGVGVSRRARAADGGHGGQRPELIYELLRRSSCSARLCWCWAAWPPFNLPPMPLRGLNFR